MTEELKYEILEKFPEFEVRRYPDHIQVQIDSRGEFNRASYSAFNPLVSYISGANKSQQKIAMTAPVIQESLEKNRHRVSFVLPSSISLENIPVPVNAELSTKVIKSHDVAVRKYRGSWGENLFQTNATELIKQVAANGLETTGNIYFARFDPPWTPWFLRRNEVLIDLAKTYH